MLRINPFAAVRPTPGHEARVASPPYDVVTLEEARSLGADNPESFIHVVRSEIDLPAGTDPYDDAVYSRARENFNGLIARGVLMRDRQPRIYLYRQVWNHRRQVGVVCCCHLDDYLADRIKKHEKTRPAKENDRTRHVLTLNANAGPVFLAYRGRDRINAIVERDTNARPLYHFNARDGVTHTVWAAERAEEYLAAFSDVDVAYVADGHHRAASAARAGGERRASNPHHTGTEEYNWFLAALFPAEQLTILSYNRVVRDLNGLAPKGVWDRLGRLGTLSGPGAPVAPDAAGSVCIYLDGVWRRLDFDPASIDRTDPIASLDVALLQERVLSGILGIGDPRTDERVDFVGGVRGTMHLEALVDSGEWAAAFSMRATSIEQLMAVADANQVMPPKSTWFEPKLRSGLLVHTLD